MGLNESEPDSVRARGEPARERRSLWQKLQIKDGTKHVKARTLVVAGMVGAGRQGRVDVEDERAVGDNRTVFMIMGSEEPAGSSQSAHSSGEAGNDRGAKGRRKEKP